MIMTNMDKNIHPFLCSVILVVKSTLTKWISQRWPIFRMSNTHSWHILFDSFTFMAFVTGPKYIQSFTFMTYLMSFTLSFVIWPTTIHISYESYTFMAISMSHSHIWYILNESCTFLTYDIQVEHIYKISYKSYHIHDICCRTFTHSWYMLWVIHIFYIPYMSHTHLIWRPIHICDLSYDCTHIDISCKWNTFMQTKPIHIDEISYGNYSFMTSILLLVHIHIL